MTPDPTPAQQRAAAALFDLLLDPETGNYRILQPSDLPTLERLSIAAQIPLTLYHVNLATLETTSRPLGWSSSPPSPSTPSSSPSSSGSGPGDPHV